MGAVAGGPGPDSGLGRGGPGVDGAAAAGPARKRRSPSTLHRLIQQAEKDLAAAERRRDEANHALLEAGADRAALEVAASALAAAADAVAAAEERWLELSAEAEG